MQPNREQFHSTVAPRHTKVLTCDEYECDAYLEGFLAIFPLMDPLTDSRAQTVREGDRRAAEFIVRQEFGNDWALDEIAWGDVGTAELNTEVIRQRVADTGVPARVFAFPIGERCFQIHRVADAPPDLSFARANAQTNLAKRWEAKSVRPPPVVGGEWNRVGSDEWIGRMQETTGEVTDIKRREGVDEMKKEMQS